MTIEEMRLECLRLASLQQRADIVQAAREMEQYITGEKA